MPNPCSPLRVVLLPDPPSSLRLFAAPCGRCSRRVQSSILLGPTAQVRKKAGCCAGDFIVSSSFWKKAHRFLSLPPLCSSLAQVNWLLVHQIPQLADCCLFAFRRKAGSERGIGREVKKRKMTSFCERARLANCNID